MKNQASETPIYGGVNFGILQIIKELLKINKNLIIRYETITYI